MTNGGVWTALAPDGVTPSSELSLAIDTTRVPPGNDPSSARISATTKALNHTLRRSLGPVALLWLILAGIGLGFGIVLIPVVLMLLFAGAAVGGGMGYALYLATHSVVLAIVVGLPMFLTILALPLSAVRGVYESWSSSVWTLTFRELSAAPQPAVTGAPAGPGMLS